MDGSSSCRWTKWTSTTSAGRDCNGKTSEEKLCRCEARRSEGTKREVSRGKEKCYVESLVMVAAALCCGRPAASGGKPGRRTRATSSTLPRAREPAGAGQPLWLGVEVFTVSPGAAGAVGIGRQGGAGGGSHHARRPRGEGRRETLRRAGQGRRQEGGRRRQPRGRHDGSQRRQADAGRDPRRQAARPSRSRWRSGPRAGSDGRRRAGDPEALAP